MVVCQPTPITKSQQKGFKRIPHAWQTWPAIRCYRTWLNSSTMYLNKQNTIRQQVFYRF